MQGELGIGSGRAGVRKEPICLIAALACCALHAAPARAQQPPPRPSLASDAVFDLQKAAFLALPEATRRAIQESLVWLGLYNGTSDGDFGKRTRDAIAAWQKNARATADGVLGPSLVRAVLAAGDRARDAVGFRMVTDPKTGARIGAPTKLFARGAKLEFVSDASDDLAALYAKLSAETPARKVAYKAMKPGAFFVVSGQDGATKFYVRCDKAEGASPPIRGFVFSYPAQAAADFDRVAVAVANSFQAFPGSAPPPVASAPAAPPPPTVSATALIVASDRALTALKPDACPNPAIGGKPARFERTDPSGLAMLAGDFGGQAEKPALGGFESDLIALSASLDKVAASAAAFTGFGARPVVVAALDAGASGAPLFDRTGRLAGIVAPSGGEPKRVSGVALASTHAVIGADAIGAFLGGGAIEPAPAARLTAGAIAEREKTRVVAVTCER
jgi:hypothetical protein